MFGGDVDINTKEDKTAEVELNITISEVMKYICFKLGRVWYFTVGGSVFLNSKTITNILERSPDVVAKRLW